MKRCRVCRKPTRGQLLLSKNKTKNPPVCLDKECVDKLKEIYGIQQ